MTEDDNDKIILRLAAPEYGKAQAPAIPHTHNGHETARRLAHMVRDEVDPHKAGLTVHHYSRARRSQVAHGTLYQLKSGPRKGMMLGANVVSYEDLGGTPQIYIASEAPFHSDDYYRMVIDTGARTLVSLTTDQDIYSRRKAHPVDAHHLEVGKTITFDSSSRKEPVPSVTCVKEYEFNSPYPDCSPIKIRKYQVRKEGAEPYDVHHIICKDWRDHGSPAKPNDAAALVMAVNSSQKILGKSPVVVNCGYGQGRTNVFIMMHQMERMIAKQMGEMLPANTPADKRLMAMHILRENMQKDYENSAASQYRKYDEKGDPLPKEVYKRDIDVDSFARASAQRVIPFLEGTPESLKQFPLQLMDAEIERFAKSTAQSVAAPASRSI